MSSELTPGEIERLQKKLLFEMLANVDLQRDNERLRERIEELEANHIPLDAKLSVSCVLEAGQLPRDLLLAVNGEPTDQAIDCCWLLGPYEREIKRLREELRAIAHIDYSSPVIMRRIARRALEGGGEDE